MNSFSEMIDNLHRLGFTIEADAVLDQANVKLPSGELIAEVMLNSDIYASPLLSPYLKWRIKEATCLIFNFYLDYFAQGKPAFVPIQYMSFPACRRND